MQGQGTLIDKVSLGKIVQIREKLFKAQALGKKVFRFESGDPDFSLSPRTLASLKAAAEAGKTHYIPNNGIPELRRALSEKLRTQNKIELGEEDVFVTNGAMHALYVTFQCLLSPGDEVIVPEPMWTEVVENIRLAGGVPVPVQLNPKENYRYTPSQIKEKIGPKTKAIFLNTPHNPTGAVIEKKDLLAIAEMAQEKNLWIVSDEAYEDVIFDPHTHTSIATLLPKSFKEIVSIFSFSKSHAMSGLRVGYIATPNALLKDRLPKLLRCTINGVNSIAQWTALGALQDGREYLDFMCGEYLKRRDLFFSHLKDIPGLKPFLPHGTFFLWCEVEAELLKKLNAQNVDELSNRLAELGLGSSPGDAFGENCHNAIRFAFSCSDKMIAEGAPLLRKFFLNT